MCGIIGYVGHRLGPAEVIRGLKRLEYRGYDSAGLAERRGEHVHVVRSDGRVSSLEAKLELDAGSAERFSLDPSIAIGHTRWATHGPPSERNAHPHRDCSGKIAVVHNGIIENHAELRAALQARGHHFSSETDTEVIAHLLSELYEGDLREAIVATADLLEGNFALCILHAAHPGIFVIRRGSPLVIGVGETELLCASDAAAIIERTRSVIYLHEGDMAELGTDGIQIWNESGTAVERPVESLTWSAEQLGKGRFSHFMRKEIGEQPRAIRDVLAGRLHELGELRLPEFDALRVGMAIEDILIVGCGSSHHAATFAASLLEPLTRTRVRTEVASELKYHPRRLADHDLIIFVSQSGETADVLTCLDSARAQAIPTLAICNVVGSTLARKADSVILTQAGPEIAVASTKAFTSQVVCLALVGLALADPESSAAKELVEDLLDLEEFLAVAIDHEAQVARLARQFSDCRAAIFLGSDTGLATAQEAALKLAEISYVPALARPLGEMKHGPLALVAPDVLCVLITTRDDYESARIACAEIESRGAPTVVLGSSWSQSATNCVSLPWMRTGLGRLGPNLLGQLFAYHVAVARDCDVDKPRHLAKSVTVA